MSSQKYEAFLKVAETGSFKEAAAELGYTQAGVSYLINALENELGLTLFVRDYGGVRLSSDGNNLLPWIQAVCNSERQLNSHLAELKHLDSGTVRVAAFTSTSIKWFPGIAKQFANDYPNIDLQLACMDNDEDIEQAIWRGDVDCGFFITPAKNNLDAVLLHNDPLLVILPENHPLANAESITGATLSEEPYIRLQSGSITEMDEVFRNNNATPRVRYTINSDYAVMSMVSAGLGFSVAPSLLLDDAPFPLAIVPPEVKTSRTIAIAVRSFETASVATRAFLKATEKWVRQTYGEEKFEG